MEDMAPIGVSGLRHSGGWLMEEARPDLRGRAGARVFREMADDDATVGAILRAIEAMVGRVSWHVDAADGAEAEAAFARSVLMDSPSQPWTEVMSETLSLLTFGWAALEILWERRPVDGRLGVKRLAPRAQETLYRWQLDPEGQVIALEQLPPLESGLRVIPADRLILFRTEARRNNPEGRSILRNAWRAWSHLKRLEEVEAIGIERDLAGLPVMQVPADYLREGTEAAKLLPVFEKIVRDVRLNAEGGVVIPSDPWLDGDGRPTGQPQFRLDLLSTGGQRAIDTATVALRYQRDIARSVLADFVMLGGDKGAYSLSRDKSSLFLKTLETLLAQIAGPLNRQLLERLWALNGLDPATRPTLRPGRVVPEDLLPLTEALERLARAGMPLFPDGPLEAHLRDKADLPAAETVTGR